ncbi:MAG: putative cobalt-precorrin-6A synthase (deacetylating) [Methanoregulaceae archaeon PtaB.Bin009]|jgi:cobalt-precorrin-5B (C1)-methyltransferase|nr:MAG: putative cobalt-precorrin-6A synthase (deacetylating) [Methanoregulaceae archaeon PtaB.Bin009]
MPSNTQPDPDRTTITDPVTGFVYPEEWVSACRDPGLRALASSGLGVLTSSGRVLRRGFTTGTTAAAACGAAILSLRGPVREVRVRIPCGLLVSVPARSEGGHAEADKFAGDYPGDATAGVTFFADARPRGQGIVLIAGAGIGRFARDTPRNSAGDPAISQAALQCIMDAIDSAAREIGLSGVEVSLSVPKGEIIAAETLNPKIGILSGISVLGTTGLVEPWDDHLTESMLERVQSAERLVITTGRLGLRYSRLLFPDHEVVLAGARIREALERARGEVILCGLPGLVLKFLDPDILEGTGCATVEELSGRPGFGRLVAGVFEKTRTAFPGLRVIVLSREGEVLGDSG